MSEPKRKKIVGKKSMILLIIAALILLSIVLQKFGVHVVNRTEDTKMIDRPHQ